MANIGLTNKDQYKYSWPEILLVISVFSKELGSRNDFGIDFDYIGYPFFIMYFFIYFRRIISYNVAPVKLFLYLIISSMFSIVIIGLPMDPFLKQIIPIIVILSVSYTVLKFSNIERVFLLYVKVTFWTAIFGIIQYFLSLYGIDILIKTPGRLDSIAYEPSHYAALLMPALVYTYLNIQKFKLYFFVMLAALILTYNLTGYLVFLSLFTFASFNPFYVIITIPIGYYLLFNVLPTFSKNFSIRFIDTFSSLTDEKNILTSRLQVNGTTLSFYSNFDVAKYSLSQNPLGGAGLGGHEEMYNRRFEGSAFQSNILYGVNAKSAHSLSIRILSELGIVGSFLYVYTLVKNLIFSRKGIYYAISLSCIGHFLCKFFKLGGYIDYGTPFFFTILIMNARAYRSSLKPQNSRVAPRKIHTVPVHQAS